MLGVIKGGIITGLVWGIAWWVLGRFMQHGAPALDRLWTFVSGVVKNPRALITSKN